MLQQEEEKLDAKINEIDDMGEDDIERMRNARLDQMKKLSKQRSEWLAQGHGSYREVDDQCVLGRWAFAGRAQIPPTAVGAAICSSSFTRAPPALK